MKICVHCGFANSDNAIFCSKCGMGLQQMTTSKAPAQILATSESNRSKLDQDYKNRTAVMGLCSLSTTFCMILIMAMPYIIAFFENKNLKYVEPMPPAVLVICFLVCVVSGMIYLKRLKEDKDSYETYQSIAHKETLIVDSYKIYGRSNKGEVSLSYSQVRNVMVRFVSTTPLWEEWVFENPILEIVDTNGKTYQFLLFKNASELKYVIENQMRSNG